MYGFSLHRWVRRLAHNTTIHLSEPSPPTTTVLPLLTTLSLLSLRSGVKTAIEKVLLLTNRIDYLWKPDIKQSYPNSVLNSTIKCLILHLLGATHCTYFKESVFCLPPQFAGSKGQSTILATFSSRSPTPARVGNVCRWCRFVVVFFFLFFFLTGRQSSGEFPVSVST